MSEAGWVRSQPRKAHWHRARPPELTIVTMSLCGSDYAICNQPRYRDDDPALREDHKCARCVKALRSYVTDIEDR